MRVSSLSIDSTPANGKDAETLVAARGILVGIGAGALCWTMILLASLLQS